MNRKIKCEVCGQENPINATRCIKCDETIRNYTYYKNDFKTYYQMFNEENLELLKKIPLTDTAYETILNTIVEIGSVNLPLVPENPTISVLLKITKPYARVQHDHENKYPEYLSFYSFNKIFLNKNTPHNLITSSIIHEFSHHLFNEIIKQSIMHLLNYEKNLYIESFAWFLTLQNTYLKIANEYVSHKVQEYFIPEHFTGYTSLIKLLMDNSDLEDKKIETALSFGKSISDDVIFILEHYIKRETYNDMPTISQDNTLGYPIHTLDNQQKINALYTIIYKTFEMFCKDKRDLLIILDELNQKYIYYNI